MPGGYGNFCGTSSAAPVVTGLAALARSVAPTAQTVDTERAIEETAVRMDKGVQSGRIDAAAAVTRLMGGAQQPAPPQPPPAPSRATVTVRATIGPGRTATYERAVGAGLVQATLTFPRDTRLTLSLTAGNGSKAAATGGTPIRIERSVPAGQITHPAAATRRTRLSSVPSARPLDGRPVGPSIGSPPPPKGDRVGMAAVELDSAEESEPPILVEVNAVRGRFKLRPLRMSPALARAADEHAASMGLRGYFAHEWSDGTPFGRWILRYYPARDGRAWVTGENLIWASPVLNAKGAVHAWLASPSHRRNLLDPRWRELGIGVVRAKGAGGVYGGHDVEIGVAEFGIR